ncbi:hypothetical protein PSQ39_09305 [Curvibacter sp. HBC28]|uniref:Uncharacterized protein n=1 Tax=Curvibacter microcysteis TaxID=3026419 RepID=A0ABT5ME11_9BURK|nr:MULTISPECIES: hypothetical protein [unclassified Curvibacter]MDD0814823.1 hypothetical protein [Curvibacter sp. HBC28]
MVRKSGLAQGQVIESEIPPTTGPQQGLGRHLSPLLQDHAVVVIEDVTRRGQTPPSVAVVREKTANTTIVLDHRQAQIQRLLPNDASKTRLIKRTAQLRA